MDVYCDLVDSDKPHDQVLVRVLSHCVGMLRASQAQEQDFNAILDEAANGISGKKG